MQATEPKRAKPRTETKRMEENRHAKYAQSQKAFRAKKNEHRRTEPKRMKKHTHRVKKRLEPKRRNTHVQSKKTMIRHTQGQKEGTHT